MIDWIFIILDEFFGVVVGGFGILVALDLVISRQRVEKKLRNQFYTHALKNHQLDAMKKLRTEIIQGEMPEDNLMAIYKKLLRDSYDGLQVKDKQLIKNALTNKDEKAKYGFMVKFLHDVVETKAVKG